VLIGAFKAAMDVYISYINLVGIFPVLLQLMQLNYVLQASISIRLNSFYVHHVFFCLFLVSLLLARGDTAMPSGLYTRRCHAFLVYSVFVLNERLEQISRVSTLVFEQHQAVRFKMRLKLLRDSEDRDRSTVRQYKFNDVTESHADKLAIL